jgi:hypothetical protein
MSPCRGKRPILRVVVTQLKDEVSNAGGTGYEQSRVGANPGHREVSGKAAEAGRGGLAVRVISTADKAAVKEIPSVWRRRTTETGQKQKDNASFL